jgi:hypothetical protein
MTELAIVGGALVIVFFVLRARSKRPGCPHCS